MSDVLERLGAALAEHYAIERQVGAGGMATVYLARDLKHDRAVALKVLRPELAAVLGIERFLSEIRVTAHLQHPHILPLFDSGQAGGLIYYVMPHVEGESLRQHRGPEQATGHRLIDARSDIYSLASVLYEMLAGEPPHTGPTVQSVIAKVLTDRPRPLRQLRESVPPHVEAAVLKALAKVPADRFQTAAEFVDALARPAWALATPGRLGRPALRDVAPWAVAGLATGLALWVSVRPRPEPPARPVARFTLALPLSAPLAEAGPPVALSPDASRGVYLSSPAPRHHPVSRKLDPLGPDAPA